METLIDKIVSKLQSMPVEKVETALELINSLDQQASEPITNGSSKSLDQSEKQAKWQVFVDEYAGIWPDFPLAEELRAGMGEDVPREPF